MVQRFQNVNLVHNSSTPGQHFPFHRANIFEARNKIHTYDRMNWLTGSGKENASSAHHNATPVVADESVLVVRRCSQLPALCPPARDCSPSGARCGLLQPSFAPPLQDAADLTSEDGSFVLAELSGIAPELANLLCPITKMPMTGKSALQELVFLAGSSRAQGLQPS